MESLIENVAKERTNQNGRRKNINIMSNRQRVSKNIYPLGARGRPGGVVR